MEAAATFSRTPMRCTFATGCAWAQNGATPRTTASPIPAADLIVPRPYAALEAVRLEAARTPAAPPTCSATRPASRAPAT